MISARRARGSLEHASVDFRRKEQDLARREQQITTALTQMRSKQAHQFNELASMRMQALAKGEVGGRLTRAEHAAMEMIEDRRELLDHLEERRSDLVEKLRIDEKKLEEKLQAIDDLRRDLESFAEEINAKISKTDEWSRQHAIVREIEGHATAADHKATTAERDRDEKRLPFEADIVFMYLWKRGFGTSAYKAGNLARYFDAKAARVVNFSQNRPNYKMLCEIPDQLRAHAQNQTEDLLAEQEKLTTIEREALVAGGIEERERALIALNDDQIKLEAALADINAEIDKMDAEHDQILAGTGDQSFARALEQLAASLADMDLRKLYDDALKTPSKDDDKLVRDLGETIKRDAELRDDLEDIREDHEKLRRRRSQFDKKRRRYNRRLDDDDDDYEYDGNILGAALEGLLTGATSLDDLDDFFEGGKRSRRKTRKRKDKSYRKRRKGFGGGFHIGGPWGGGGGSGGFGGGGFGSGGGMGGGGFSSGGGF